MHRYVCATVPLAQTRAVMLISPACLHLDDLANTSRPAEHCGLIAITSEQTLQASINDIVVASGYLISGTWHYCTEDHESGLRGSLHFRSGVRTDPPAIECLSATCVGPASQRYISGLQPPLIEHEEGTSSRCPMAVDCECGMVFMVQFLHTFNSSVSIIWLKPD